MLCPNCGNNNPEGAKFCNQCGQSLSIDCPNCGHQNQPGSKFCSECGTRLQEIPPSTPAESAAPLPASPDALMQSLIPEDFAAKLESARAARTMVGERRVVTMLFCDIKGSTGAAEHLDPEDWAAIMNGAFEYMIRPVYKYEGMVARLMGDAVLAFFGAPIAHEDDPQRAILAGLEILEGFKAYKDQVLQDWELEIDARVGINTGLVMVGVIGSDLRMEYTAMGDAINLASRMEQTAEPGTVQVAEDTYRLAATVFEWAALGEIEVKGKTEPVQTFRPLHRKFQTKRERGIEGLDAPLIGRDMELGKLKAAAEDLRRGIGGIVFIEGEAGLGKSRLVEELRRSLHHEYKSQVDWQETTSLSYETAQPYALFQRLLRRRWEIQTNSSPEYLREKIALEFEADPETEKVQKRKVFEILMGVGETGETQLEGEAFKRELFKGTTTLWDSGHPSILICDDLHWADPASTELLGRFFSHTERAALLLVCIMRPDRKTPGWEIKEIAERDYPHRYTEISLHPLTNEDTNLLVDKLLNIADLPAGLRQNILEKTDGNPFFVEEVVRTLIDQGAIVSEQDGGIIRWRATGDLQKIEIPGNLQALLTARIDRLEEDARLTLQLASVIGRSFFYRVLESINQAVAAIHSELDQQLLTLQRMELIREATRVPELEYMFRHSLTQEAAYNTILLRQRGEFHCQVGDAIETQFADRLEEFYPVLAYHFGEANDPRGLKYAILSGDAALQIFAIPEAMGYYHRALEYTKSGQASPETLQHIYLHYGRCLELQSDYQAAQQIYEQLASLARAEDNQHMLLAALMAGAIAYAIPSPAQHTETGQNLADESLTLARQLGDQESEAKTLWAFTLLRIYGGRILEGISSGERSVQLARQLGMTEQLAYSLQDLALAYIAAGHLDKADAAMAEARPLWDELGNLPMLAENWANTTYLRLEYAQFEEAIASSEESFRIANAIENERGQVNSQGFIGLVYVMRGEVDQALQQIRRMMVDAERVGHPAHILGYCYQSWLYAHLGAHDLALETAQRGAETLVNFKPFHPFSLVMLAKQRIRLGEYAEAQALLVEAGEPGLRQTLQMNDQVFDLEKIEYHLALREFSLAQPLIESLLGKMSTSGTRLFLPDALYMKASYLQQLGEVDEAKKTLQEAQSAAEEIESRIVLWQILAEFGKAKAAREIVEFILGNISDSALRETFHNYSESVIERRLNIDRIGS